MGGAFSKFLEQRALRLQREQAWRLKTCQEIIHPFSDSCYKSFFIVWADSFVVSFKFYATLFTFGALFGLWKGKKHPLSIIQKGIISTIKSAAFMCTMGASTLPISCFFRYLAGQFRPTLVYVAGALAGFIAILIEAPSRRKELAVYTALNIATESIYRAFMIRHWVPNFKYGDVAVFMTSMSIISYLYNHERNNLGNIRAVLQFLLGDKNTPLVTIPPPSDQLNRDSHSVTEFASKDKLCKHKSGCVVNTIRGFLRGLVIGLLVKGGFSVVVNVFWKKLYKKPNELKAAIFDPATKDFALFLAFFVSSFKGVNCLMKNIRETDDGLNSLISGAVSGLSVLFSGRSVEMIMFCFSKALEGMWNSLVAKKMITPMQQGGDILVFSLFTGFLFYCATLEPYNLRTSYWRFLQTISCNRFSQFEPLAKYSNYIECITDCDGRAYRPEHWERTTFKYPNG